MKRSHGSAVGAAAPDKLAFLANGGETGNRLKMLGSAESPLGAPAQWPGPLKALLATVLPAHAQIVVFWGEQFVALYNDAYAPSIGDKHPHALGRPASEHWTELWADLWPLLQGVRDTGQTFSARDRPFYIERHGGGETVYFDVSYSAVPDADGTVGGVLCVVTETTERVKFQHRQATLLQVDLIPATGGATPTADCLNDELERRVLALVNERAQAIAQLQEARKMETVGRLGGGVAHEFNNLLTPIISSLELLRRRCDEPRSIKLIDIALQAAERARELIARLLTFAGRHPMRPQAVHLTTLMNDLTPRIRQFLAPGTTLQINVPDTLPALWIDPHYLELAVLNLATNAQDAMPADGVLTISANIEPRSPGVKHDYVRLLVSDTGRGMDEHTRARCIDPFFSTKGVGNGTGLGLSTVHGMVLQAGGCFSITSQPEEGTQVSLWLPTITQ
ncbi:signal transduction histidine kinase [Pseudomonas sp. TE3610]